MKDSCSAKWIVGILAMALALPCALHGEESALAPDDVTLISIDLGDPAPPPEWALWQRQLLDLLHPAALEFVQRYTRADGSLIWREAWPGMDGSDDGYESFYNFPLYYALGGPEEIHTLSHKLWDAVTRQFTAYGQVHKEFDAYYDWMHHGESYVYFYFFGLADPSFPGFAKRARRFAGLYLNEDPAAQNYDFENKVIRSPINGSRGPRFVNSAEDWVTHRDVLAHYPLPFDDIPNVEESSAWVDDEKFSSILQTMNTRMMRGDVPLNLTSTSLILNAYMLGREDRYKDWIEHYVDAWIERVRENDGILPDNVGLSGKVGEFMDGKWWGGYYGWKWPHGLFNQLESTLIGATNAYLVSGEARYLELPRSVIDLVRSKGKVEDGVFKVPHRHDERGWYDFRPINASYLLHLWYVSQQAEDLERLLGMANPKDWETLRYRKGKGDFGHESPWLRYLQGNYPDYPVQILKANYRETLRRLQMIRSDTSPPEERNVHHWQARNPVVLEGLVQTMLGGPNHIYHGGLLHCRLRYFDPERKRPGVPPHVAALVDQLRPDGMSVQLVNLHPTETRSVILQAGAFGEHQFLSAGASGENQVDIGSRVFEVRLKPGSLGRLEIKVNRYANRPTYAVPWDR